MSDEATRELVVGKGDTSLARSDARSSLVRRGRSDLARLREFADVEFEPAIGLTWGDPDEIAPTKNYEGVIQAHGTEYLDYAQRHGKPVCRQDYAAALNCFRRAAEEGNEAAQFNIGVMYQNGCGVETDFTKAAEWYLKGAKQGRYISDFCEFNLGVMYQTCDTKHLQQDYARAAEWYRRAAENWYCDDIENPSPQFKPETLQERNSTEPYPAEAVRWYRRIWKGNSAAQFNLGLLYEFGYGVAQNYVLAHMWLDKSASGAVIDGEEIPRERVARAKTACDRVVAKMSTPEIAASQYLAGELKELFRRMSDEDRDVIERLKTSLANRRA